MLLELTIKDFAIIDQVHIALSPGLNVITGETGAGKSIVIDAVGALLGSRIGAEFVRAGASSSRVEGIFTCPSAGNAGEEELHTVLSESGLEAEDDTLIISRETSASGRNIARVNGQAVPVNVLQRIGHFLIDIHGQTEHLSLLRLGRQLDFMDSYGDFLSLRRKVGNKVTSLRGTRRQIQELTRDTRETARQIDLLTFQINEITAAALQPNEEDELETERRILANAESLIASAEAAYQALYDGVEEQRSALDLLGDAENGVTALSRMDDSVAPQAQILEEARYKLEDVAHFLRAYRDRVECDPSRLEEVEERLELISSLKRKYGASISEVLAFRDKSQLQLESITTSEDSLTNLREEEQAILVELSSLAEQLSVARFEAASKLAASVEKELAGLGMVNSRFEVKVERRHSTSGLLLSDGQICDFDGTGIDEVEFMLSPNRGEPVKPLAKIASGGEISRVMLALKTVLSREDPVATLIFDEVDAGIGGRTGSIIGRKLWNLGQAHQVICVTHLPQIAAFSDQHLNITKLDKEDRTVTSVDPLDGEQRVGELAAMLGGADTEAARENARELIRSAQRWKEDDGTIGG